MLHLIVPEALRGETPTSYNHHTVMKKAIAYRTFRVRTLCQLLACAKLGRLFLIPNPVEN